MDSFRLLARMAFILSLLAIAYLAFAPFEEAPGLGYDKANHALAFLVLAGLAETAWPASHLAGRRLGGLLVYGLGIELIQSILPYREAAFWDLFADLFGVGVYLTLRHLSRSLWRRLSTRVVIGR